MSTAMLSFTNGAKPTAPTQDWLLLSVHTFFTNFNWEDHSLAVQSIKQSALNGEPLSLMLSVSQFFAATPWDGSVVASATSAEVSIEDAGNDSFTLENFSDLF